MAKKQHIESVQNIRESKDLQAVTDLTFFSAETGASITAEQKKALEQYLQRRLGLWWETWIEPQLRALEQD